MLKNIYDAFFTKKFTVPNFPPFTSNESLEPDRVEYFFRLGVIYFLMIFVSVFAFIMAIPGGGEPNKSFELLFAMLGYGPPIFCLWGLLLTISPRRFYVVAYFPFLYGLSILGIVFILEYIARH
jgi:hypothetical protein